MNILIADDHVLFRDGLRLILTSLADDLNIIEAASLDEALARGSQEESIDLFLLELGAPGVGGTAGIRALRKVAPESPIVVLGASRRRDDVLAALESGANGYIPRTATAKLLLSALRLVLDGETYVPSMLLGDSDAAGKPAPDPFARGFGGALARLTARQRDVLLLLVRGFSNAEIAKDIGIEVNTVKNHVKAVMKALDARSRTQAVLAAIRLGLRPPGGTTR